ncbi:hypothetical protein EYD45_15575 [Hyunsoonleella flava]|uniref:DUF4136 domain-containing protein n=1 Tax=Hyunsoonleella flava TaxID=2527939 RepID=A0A4Q9FGJ5_9FLAO|nr:hypothetical protein [Hyunsoonleella flava]TBM99377.1 hypothetical protein EYD45_15575 [Hyunsoonleella flava]
MRFLTTLVLAFLFSASVFSQSHKAEIQKEAQNYYNLMTDMNIDGFLDYMYPKVFEMVTKEQMKTGMEQMFNSPQMKIEFISNDVKSISDEKEVDGVNYAVVYYNSKMRMTFLTEKDKPEADRQAYLDMMKTNMAAQFGAENVTVDVATTSVVINNDASMFAINDPQYDGWKFLGNEKNMAAMVNSMIPEAVRTALLEKE